MNSISELSDAILINSYINGNTNAFTLLIHRHKSKIYTAIFLLVKDKYLAEDIFQETFIKIIDRMNNKRYNEEGKFLSWAMRIAHNLCIDHFRKLKRMPAIVTSDEKDLFEFMNIVEPSIEEKIMSRETDQTINKLLDLIPLDQREVIILRHYAGLSFKEIAVIMDCSINTALGRMRYGLSNLRKILDEKKIALQ